MRRPDKVAELVVSRFNLEPPVDIGSLLEAVADVESLSWPYECDAVVSGLSSGGRPRVFVRSNQPSNRWPFTVAHEYGHVMIPWHVETSICHVSSPGSLRYEQEANDFASRILVPQRFLEALAPKLRSPDEWLNALDNCGLSAHASILSLRRILPSGYLFVIEQDVAPSVAVESVGTGLFSPNLSLDHGNLRRGAKTTGRQRFRGRDVRWYKYIDDSPPRVTTDSRAASSILESVLARLGDQTRSGRDRQKVLSSIIGGKLRDRALLDEGQMYGIVIRHLELTDDWRHFVSDGEFRDYLRRRMAELAYRG